MSPRRALASVLIALVVLALADVALLLRPEQVRRRLLEYVRERARGGDVEISAVRLRLFERVRIPYARISPRLAGATLGPAAASAGTSTSAPAGPVVGSIEVKGLIVEHSPTALLLGEYRPTRVFADEVTIETADPPRMLEALRALADIDLGSLAEPSPSGGSEVAPVQVARLRLRHSGGEIPLAAPEPVTGGARPGGDEAVLEHVELRPVPRRALEAGPTARTTRRFTTRATARLGPFEAIDVSGELDLDLAVFRCEVRATNLDLRARRLESLAPEVRSWFEALGPSGPIDLTLDIYVPWESLSDTVMAGFAESYSVELHPKGFPRPITNVSARVRFEESRVRIESLRGVYGKGEMRAHGTVGDIATGAGVDLEIDADDLDLAEVAEAPMPPPFDGAVRALGLTGRTGLHLSLTTEPRETLSRAKFRLEARLARAASIGGTLSAIEGRATLSGTRPEGRASGRLRIDRAEAVGVPVRGLEGRLSVDADAVVLDEVEGRLAGGTVHGGGSLLLRADAKTRRPEGSATLDLVASDVELAPFTSSAYGRPVETGGRASGTLSLKRARTGSGAEAHAALALVDVDLRSFPGAQPLAAEGLPVGPSPRGALELLRREDGGGEARAMLEGAAPVPAKGAGGSLVAATGAAVVPSGPLAIEVAFTSDLAIRGHARGAGKNVSIAGTLAMPRVVTVTAEGK